MLVHAPCMVGWGTGGSVPFSFSGGGGERICFMAEQSNAP